MVVNNKKRKIVYSIIFNDYDYIKDPLIVHPDWEYIMITDNPLIKSDYWDVHVVDKGLNQRHIKLCPHKYFKNPFDYTFYVDGSVHIQAFNPEDLITHTQADIVFKWHPINKNAYDEADTCIALNKSDDSLIEAQIAVYRAEGLPTDIPTYETGYMFRKASPETFTFCDKWYREIENWTNRDQISISYVVWKYKDVFNLTIAQFTPEGWDRNFIQSGHITSVNKHKVHYFTPYSTDMNLGKAYNEACEQVPDGEWIAIMDADSMFLNNRYGVQVQDIIERHGTNIGLFGCTTNRLKDTAQLYQEKHSEESNILIHKQIADTLFEKEYSNIKIATKPIAGLFMLFNKDIWKKNKFKNGLMTIDTDFCFRLAEKNIPIGICKGLYVFHYYRLLEGMSSIKHLQNNSIKESEYLFNRNKVDINGIVEFIEKSGLLTEVINKGLSPDILKYLKRQ